MRSGHPSTSHEEGQPGETQDEDGESAGFGDCHLLQVADGHIVEPEEVRPRRGIAEFNARERGGRVDDTPEQHAAAVTIDRIGDVEDLIQPARGLDRHLAAEVTDVDTEETERGNRAAEGNAEVIVCIPVLSARGRVAPISIRVAGRNVIDYPRAQGCSTLST